MYQWFTKKIHLNNFRRIQQEIQQFKESDYGGYINLINTIYPKHPISLESKLHEDKLREKKIYFKKLVLKNDRNLFAALTINQWEDAYHPDKYVMNIFVHPKYEQKGIGELLYKYMEDLLLPRNPVKITSEVWEPHVQSISFLEKRGFKLAATEKECKMDLQKYNPKENCEKIDRILKSGFHLITLHQLRQKDKEADRKIWEFEREVAPDMPWTDEITVQDYPVYKEQVLQHPKFDSRAWLLVMKGDEIAGLNNLWKSNLKMELNNGLTGVRRKYRRQGVATALKHANLKWAKEEGFQSVKTENESTNNGMLNINIEAGFEFMPSWLYFEKTKFY